MKPSCFACLLLFLAATLFGQSTPVPLVNQHTTVVSPASAPQVDSKAQARILDNYGKLPLSFEANQGQADAEVKFLSRGAGYTLFLTSDEAVFSLSGKNGKHGTSGVSPRLRPTPDEPTANAALRMKLVKASRAAKVTGSDELPGRSNYFIGNDPKSWHSSVPTYSKVRYEGVYSGIDLVYYGNQRQLEYDFVVKPGADPRRIQFDVHGAKRIRRDEHGDLVLQMPDGEVRWHKPLVYQERGSGRQEIAARYLIKDKRLVGFEVADYDLQKPLFIDPLVYSTYLGGSAYDNGLGVAVDSSGNAYVIGFTASTNFPTLNALQPTNGGGNYDAFVAKLNPSGSALLYSTYLGGNGDDRGYGIAVDSPGNAYVTGFTVSTNFPTINPLQPANAGGSDVFVAKLNSSGSALLFSTYFGGSGDDTGSGIAVDGSGNAYVTGSTRSTNFPTMNPLQPTYGGDQDAFVAKLNPSGSALVYSTYLGGSVQDYGAGIAVDSSGDAYVSGNTNSTDFPTMNPLQPSLPGIVSVFVTKLNTAGSALVYSTYLGGSDIDEAFGIAVDSLGNAYVTGGTTSTNFPIKSPLQSTYGGGSNDAFVTKINSAGSALVYSTYLGGNGDDRGYGIAVDSSGDAYVTGLTLSTNFPTMNPLQPTYGGNDDAFVSKLNAAGSALVYSTYLGGSGSDSSTGIAVDSSGNAYITGGTNSTNFPTKNPLQQKYGGGQVDSFVAKIAKPSPALKFTPRNLSFGNETVSVKSTPRNSTLTNIGDGVLTVASIKVAGPNSGDFAETNNCPASLASLESCTIAVTFTPTTTGTRTASVSVTDNASHSPQSLPLAGVGVLPAVTFSPTSLTFPDQVVFTTSKAKTVKLTNAGLGILTVKSITVTGPFSQTHTCGTTVNPGGSCTINVTFTPKSIGTLTGSISITDNAHGSPQKVSLTGTGTYVQMTPASLNFGNQPVGTKSLPQTITLSNKGSVAVSIATILVTGANAGDFAQTNTCGKSVAAGASCSVTVTFKPLATGKRNAAVSVSDNGGGSPQKVSLTGTGT